MRPELPDEAVDYSQSSPFSRKVRIAAALAGLDVFPQLVLTDTLDPADPIREKNLLGKIPMLETRRGRLCIYGQRG